MRARPNDPDYAQVLEVRNQLSPHYFLLRVPYVNMLTDYCHLMQSHALGPVLPHLPYFSHQVVPSSFAEFESCWERRYFRFQEGYQYRPA